MSAFSKIALSLAIAAVAGCNALPLVGADSTQAEPTSTPANDGDGPWLFTDPPLPTFDQKTPRPTEPRASIEMPDCVDWDVQVDEIPGVQPLMRMSWAVVIATFEAYGEPRWNTVGGERPTWEEHTNADYPVTIIRDVRLQVEDYLRGTPAELEGAYVRGGQIGCDAVSYGNMPEFRAGDRAIFFFAPLDIPALGAAPLPQLARVWLLGDDASVLPYSGAGVGTVDELRALLEEVPFTPWPSVRDALPSQAPVSSGAE